MSSGETIAIILFAFAVGYFPVKWILTILVEIFSGEARETIENARKMKQIEIEEPEESEAERQFRVYGDYYGYSYYGDDDKQT